MLDDDNFDPDFALDEEPRRVRDVKLTEEEAEIRVLASRHTAEELALRADLIDRSLARIHAGVPEPADEDALTEAQLRICRETGCDSVDFLQLKAARR